jgi:hypothetical protein
MVPANPFAGVNDDTLAFFVAWSLEHSTREHGLTRDTTSFDNVPLAWGRSEQPPPPEPPPSANPVPAGRDHRASRVGLISGLLGLALGAAIGVFVAHGLRRPGEPATAAQHPAPGTATPTPPASPAIAVPAAARPVTEPASVAPEAAPSHPAPTPSRAPATAAASAPLADKATLIVITRPDGAQVQIDGRRAGTTPLEVALHPGRYLIEIERQRYEAVNREVEVAPGAPTKLALELARPSAKLVITSRPPDAPVTLDRRMIGRTPLEVTRPAYEHYRVGAALNGCQAIERTVYLKPNSPALLFSCTPNSSKAR